MSSMHLLTKILEQQNKDCYLLVELDEPGRPHSIVHSKNVVGSLNGISKGETAEVKYNRSVFLTTVLGYGELLDKILCTFL